MARGATRGLSSSSLACFTAFIVVCNAAVLQLTGNYCRPPIPSSCKCPSFHFFDIGVICPTFSLFLKSYNIVEVQCFTNDDNEFSELNGADIGEVRTFKMQHCQLLSVPVSRLMQNVNVSGVFNLILQDITHLADDVFTDLPDLKYMKLEYDNVVLPKSIFRGVSNLVSLELSSKNLTYLEPGVFHNLTQLEYLTLYGNFRNLSRAVFSDVHNLQRLNITLNEMTDLPHDIFVDLINLNEITLHRCEFPSLPQDLFINNPRLRTVRVENNRRSLETLPSRLLANLNELNEVILTGCNISSLPENLLWDSIHICIISLNNNALTTLPQKLFRDCSILEELDLSFNRITDLHEQLFSYTGKLKELNLSNNRLTTISNTFCSIKFFVNERKELNGGFQPFDVNSLEFLKKINMANNMLTFENSFTPSLSPLNDCIRLENIQLANNSLTKIYSDWRNMKFLKTLDLSHNKISRLESADLNFVGSGTITVDISHNNISDLDINLLDSEKDYDYRYAVADKYYTVNKYTDIRHNRRYFNIGGNPNKCGCERYSLLEYKENKITAEVTLVMENKYNDNKKYGIVNVCEGLSVNDIPIQHLTCLFKKDYSTVCPKQCSCVFRLSDNVVIVDCHKRNLTSMPAALPDVWFSSHTELNLSGNRIKSVKSPLGSGYNRVTKYNLSDNVISDIDFTAFFPKLQVLAIDRNNISQLNESSIDFLRNATHLTELTLHGNPWTCDSQTESFATLIQSFYNSKTVKLFDNTICKNSGQVLPTMLGTTECFLGEPDIKTVLAVFIVVGILTGVVAGGFLFKLMALCYKFQNKG